jgi:hypothetical protein
LYYRCPFYRTGNQNTDYTKSLKALVLPTVLHSTVIDEVLLGKNQVSTQEALEKLQKNVQDVLDNNNIYGSLHQDYAQDVII